MFLSMMIRKFNSIAYSWDKWRIVSSCITGNMHQFCDISEWTHYSYWFYCMLVSFVSPWVYQLSLFSTCKYTSKCIRQIIQATYLIVVLWNRKSDQRTLNRHEFCWLLNEHYDMNNICE